MSAGDRVALVGLATLPSMGPKRLRSILEHYRPGEALALLAAGRRLDASVEAERTRDLFDRLRAQARSVEPERVISNCAERGIAVTVHGDPDYPAALSIDPDPPDVLFVRGRLEALDARRVGIVGTRNATAAGRATAFELGEALAAHDVAVISGLARGIDGAAHRGVRSACGRPVAVVGCGPDRPYPKQNADLWEWVAGNGLLVSEWPPGTQPDAWRFPLRNRIIAALSEVLVVVESRESGGSLITADAAGTLGVTIMAVPGSTRSPASRGTNKLLVDGATPVTCVDDVLVALGLDHSRQAPRPESGRSATSGVTADLLELCAERPCTLDTIAEQLRIPVTEAAVAARHLEDLGLLIDTGGWLESPTSKLAWSKGGAP